MFVMNKNSNGFAPILIILILTFIGIAGFAIYKSNLVSTKQNHLEVKVPLNECGGWDTSGEVDL